jgi:cytochrome c
MDRSITARSLTWFAVSAVGAAGAVSACSASDPALPPDPNPIVVTTATPPPISGGTLLVTSGGLAVAADSDRDVVHLVDLAARAVSTVALQPGDEPGRVIQDGQGRVHVALRRGGAIATIDLASKQVVARTPVCSAPRGLAFDASANVIDVACAGGELVTIGAADGALVRTVRFAERDLRDVLVQDGQLLVTRFRSAEVLAFGPTGELTNRATPLGITDPGAFGATFSPTTAWRAIPQAGGGGVFVVHQFAADSSIVISQPGGYGSNSTSETGCSSTIVQTTIASFDATGAPSGMGLAPPAINGASVPVDLAADGNGNLAVASAGADAIFLLTTSDLASGSPCVTPTTVLLHGQPVAVAFAPLGFVAQLRELTPGTGQGPALEIIKGNAVTVTIPLPGASMENTGHSLFHHNASATSSLACASCHAEGHEDGHVWVFDTLGSRRTQTVSGGVLATAPLHWNGDMSDLTDIMHEVFEQRMSGNPLEAGPLHVEAFGAWLNTIPAYPASPTGTSAQIAHGKQLFESSTVGCTTCHSGPHLTNNQTVAVGTGQAFQVPTLVGVAARAPFMHDGCARTLSDRFDATQAACNGGELHGTTAHLSTSEVADLMAYLETL